MLREALLAALVAVSMAACSGPSATPTNTPPPTATPTVRQIVRPIEPRQYPDPTFMPDSQGESVFFSRAADNPTKSDGIVFAMVNQGKIAAEHITVDAVVNYYGTPLYFTGVHDRLEAKQPVLFFFSINEAIEVPKPTEIDFLEDRVEAWVSIDPRKSLDEGQTGENNNRTGRRTLYITPPLSSGPAATLTSPQYPDLAFREKLDGSLDVHIEYLAPTASLDIGTATASIDNGKTRITVEIVNQGEAMAPASTLAYSISYKNVHFPMIRVPIPSLTPDDSRFLTITTDNNLYIDWLREDGERLGKGGELSLFIQLDYTELVITNLSFSSSSLFRLTEKVIEGPGEYNNSTRVTFILDP